MGHSFQLIDHFRSSTYRADPKTIHFSATGARVINSMAVLQWGEAHA
jgi:hypothetical protein